MQQTTAYYSNLVQRNTPNYTKLHHHNTARYIRAAAARSGFGLGLSVGGGLRVSRREGGGGAQRVCVGAFGGGRAAGLCWGFRSMAGVRAAAARSGFVSELSVEGAQRVWVGVLGRWQA